MIALPRAPDHRSKPHLSRREQEVFDLVVEGKSNQEVADQLSIDVRTVKFHMGRIMLKKRQRSRAKLIVAYYTGWEDL